VNIYHVIAGTVSVRDGHVEQRRETAGASFGALSLYDNSLAGLERQSLVSIGKCMMMKLRRGDYLRICSAMDTGVVDIMRKEGAARTPADVEVALGFFHESPVFRMLFYRYLKEQACRLMHLHLVQQGDTVAEENAHGDTLYTLISGRTQSIHNSQEKPPLAPGDSFGFDCVLGAATSQQVYRTTVNATSDCAFATISRADFGTPVSLFIQRYPSQLY
jgi:hypothetical protein